ncbi:MAG: HNH endonuclease domain-containing protein [Bacteroidales bacterium]|nr:HNH endonuclease domain-containing protein [Bacteroidales bacterium]
MTLPSDNKLDIRPLSQIYNNTVTTYKYYWFVSILDIVSKEGRRRISFWEIIVGMVAEAWYPIHYFRLSYGKSDSLYEQIIELQHKLNIPIDAQKTDIKKRIINNLENSQIKSLLRVFILNVPYRFLSPWIHFTTNADVSIQSKTFANNCLYAIDGEYIDVNSSWQQYLTDHYAILRDFTFWNLTIFLQKRNPNVPDIPSKLIKPIQRNSLTKQHHFWDAYIDIVGSIKCIYTGKTLHKNEYDLDHFIPWSYVCHNLLWNLLPADSSINSSKSNNLPSLDDYLRPFAQMHHNALKELYPRNPSNKLLEDYLVLDDSISELVGYSDEDFFRIYQKTFSPMTQIAANMGFSYWQNPLVK